VGAIIAICVVAGLLIAFWAATREVYFLGTDASRANAVTMYRGLPYDLPLGIKLYSPVVSSGVTLDAVSPARRRTFTDHKLRSRKDAKSLLVQLQQGRIQ
jgi:protein phosphatase